MVITHNLAHSLGSLARLLCISMNDILCQSKGLSAFILHVCRLAQCIRSSTAASLARTVEVWIVLSGGLLTDILGVMKFTRKFISCLIKLAT